MSLVNFTAREITCKIVYYGPGRSGKTTNLQYVYGRVPEARRGRMVSLATQTDRTLFFEQMIEQLVSAAPREQTPPPMLADNFESELNASLKALFGR